MNMMNLKLGSILSRKARFNSSKKMIILKQIFKNYTKIKHLIYYLSLITKLVNIQPGVQNTPPFIS